MTAASGTRPATFRFLGRDYPYFEHPYNMAAFNERTVEVPIVRAALEACAGRALEVGNVMAHYGVAGHTVVDKYEPGEGVLNVDIADYLPEEPFDLLVSISTLEHVGWDEEYLDPLKIPRVLERMRSRLLAPNGGMLLTVPLGYNPFLDRLVEEDGLGVRLALLGRKNEANEWEELPRSRLGVPRYGHPFRGGNVIAVLWD